MRMVENRSKKKKKKKKKKNKNFRREHSLNIYLIEAEAIPGDFEMFQKIVFFA